LAPGAAGREHGSFLGLDMRLQLMAERLEQPLQVVQLGMARAVHAHDRVQQVVDPRQLGAQRVAVGGDDVVAQLGDRHSAPIVAFELVPIHRRILKRFEHSADGVRIQRAALARLGERLAAAEAVVKPQPLEHLCTGGLLGDQEAEAGIRIDHLEAAFAGSTESSAAVPSEDAISAATNVGGAKQTIIDAADSPEFSTDTRSPAATNAIAPGASWASLCGPEA
jgi:hypothetical protein